MASNGRVGDLSLPQGSSVSLGSTGLDSGFRRNDGRGDGREGVTSVVLNRRPLRFLAALGMTLVRE